MPKLVFRVTGIPLWATASDIKDVLLLGEEVKIERMTITPSCYGDGTQTAIVQFEPCPPKYLEKVVSGSLQDRQRSMYGSDINIDKNFYGLTQLYRIEDEAKIAADIVAVTGLAGHAFGSWRGKGDLGRMWLQDFFSEDLPNCRTMIYGHNSGLLDNGIHQIKDYNQQFIWELTRVRSSILNEGKIRPIILIGHSFGGIIITQSLVKCKDLSGSNDAADDIFKSTYATAFFGTPHRGLFVDDILSMAHEMEEERIELVQSIGGGEVLRDELETFIGLAPGLKILSFYEQMKTKRLKKANGSYSRAGEYFIPVSRESALLDLNQDIETSIPVDADHTNMVKFNAKGDAAYRAIIFQLKLFLEQLRKKESTLGNGNMLHQRSMHALVNDILPELNLGVPKQFTRHRTIPHSVSPQFTGRDDILERLKDYFFPLNPPDSDQRLVFVLHGMGGSGKSQISLEFIRKYGSRFWGIFWIDASTPEMTEQSFCDIAREFRLEECTPKAAKLYLANCKKENQWLLVIDNADDPDIDLGGFFPRGDMGNILVTTRNPECRSFCSENGYFEVDAMNPEDAVKLLLRITKLDGPSYDFNKPLATKIVQAVGCLALAITHAGAFIENGSTMDTYLEHLRESPKELFGIRFAQGSGVYKRRTVFTTWELSFNSLKDPSASHILQIFAFFHYDRIPKDIFRHASKSHRTEELPQSLSRLLIQRPDGTWNSLNFEASIRNLLSFSLVKQDTYREKIIYSIHPLVHTWCRERLEYSDQASFRKLASTLLESSVDEIPDEVTLIQWIPHIVSCKRTIPGLALFIQPACFFDVYSAAGRWKEAEEVAIETMNNYKKELGDEHSSALKSMSNLASTYWDQGKWKEAEALQVVALEVRKRVLGEEHPSTLTSMGNLALTYSDQGKWKEAEALQVVALEVSKRVLGEEHPDTLKSMSNLALTYSDQGKWKEAEALQVVALEVRKRVLGEEHPSTLTSMGNLALTYSDQGKWKEAEALQVVALEVRKRVLGEEHPDTLLAEENLVAFREEAAEAELQRRKRKHGDISV
ncbi:hypothetical protein DFP73DRAFT_516555 [Morchella snyderi]|nr:hypothetical protein DFP73DRAFT_516555 [Morchella snyderi]